MQPFLTLKRSSQFLCIVVLGCSSILGMLLMWEYGDHALEASRAARDLQRFIKAIDAVNTIAAERGPANALVAAQGSRPDLMANLAAIRRDSDAGLTYLADDAMLTPHVAMVRDRLREARAVIDAITARSSEARTMADVDRTVTVMVAVIDAAEPLIDATTRRLTARASSSLTGDAMLIRALSDMRDYAGRMGSALMVPLALRQAIRPEQRAAYESAKGRVLELKHLVSGTIWAAGDSATRAALADMEARFFGGCMDIFRSTLAASQDGSYPMDREMFTASVQPGFRTLSALRDAVAGQAWRSIDANGRGARRSFVLVSAVTFILVSLECTLVFAARRLIFRPLLDARDAILGLASGRMDDLPTHPEAVGEMADLFGALTALQEQIRQRDVLDRENRHLAAQLRDLADRDGLTGLLNRGALERTVTEMTGDGSDPDALGLVLFDIDHFKAINDSFGHNGGDCVLRLLAARWRETMPDDVVFARYGGEEFAVVASNIAMPSLRRLAEDLRLATAAPVRLASGALIRVTASFGVAVTPRGPDAWATLVEQADRRLYVAKGSGRDAVAWTTEGGAAHETKAVAA